MSQANRLYELLKDDEWHDTPSILDFVYGNEHLGIARISARIKNLKDKGHLIEGRKDEKRPTVYWYRLISHNQAQEAPTNENSTEKREIRRNSNPVQTLIDLNRIW